MKIHDSAEIIGKVKLGVDSVISYGSKLESEGESIAIGTDSTVLENCYLKGTVANPVTIGQHTFLGHRCSVIGASIGNCCEVGNGVIMEKGTKVGDYCIFGEGTILPENTVIPDYSVVLGNPFRILRKTTQEDKDMIASMRSGTLDIVEEHYTLVDTKLPATEVPLTYPFNEKTPKLKTGVFRKNVEIIGDVSVDEDAHFEEGVKIIGDSHGPVYIGKNVTIGKDTVLHLLPHGELIIKDNVTIGANCVVHGCTLEENVIIEDDCLICDHVKIGKNSKVLKNSLVPQRKVIGEDQTISGYPVR